VEVTNRGSYLLPAAALIAALCGPLAAQFGAPPQKPKGPWMDASLPPDKRADLVAAQMTLDEKLSLLHGGGWQMLFAGPDGPASKSLGGAGYIPGIPRLGIPDLQIADAAVGVTRGAAFGRYATALPSCIAAASSWDLELAREYGSLIGTELRAQGFNMSLGGGLNLTREPRNGRNFEYRGEDPILAGRMVGAEMKALQSLGVIGDIKHYALNDQEGGRMFVNVKMGKRVMRETDLLAFEIAVKESGAGAVMCSYNLVNGDYACENNYLLNDVLKKDFGFQGFVVSDWGGTHSTAKAANAGLDMEMPSSIYFAGRSRTRWRAVRFRWPGWITWSTGFCAASSPRACSTSRCGARRRTFSTGWRWRSVWRSRPRCCSRTRTDSCRWRRRGCGRLR
jgi:beta-glucosidase